MITTYLLLLSLVFLSAIILVQDYTNRKVHVILLLAYIVVSAYFQILQNVHIKIYLIESAANFSILFLMLLSLFIYFKWLRKIALSSTIGLGDLILFGAFVLGYSTIEFVIHFTIGLMVSLLLHLLLKKNYTGALTVPLAGYMSIYLSCQKVLHEFIPVAL